MKQGIICRTKKKFMIAYVIDIFILRELLDDKSSVLGVFRRLEGKQSSLPDFPDKEVFTQSSVYNAFRRLRVSKWIKEIPTKGKEKPCEITAAGIEALRKTEVLLSATKS